MKKKQFKMTRRQVLKAGIVGGAGLMMPLRFLPAKVFAAPIIPGLSDPALQPMFGTEVPDALMPGFKYTPQGRRRYVVGAGPATQATGLIDTSGGPNDGNSVMTDVWGYGQGGTYTWPGMTFEVQAGERTIVRWENDLPIGPHLLPVDTTLHWSYSLHGYTGYSIEANGVPIVMHLHGGHSKDLFDGNPEQFFGPGYFPRGPRFQSPNFVYDNDQIAGNLWYHDHSLGITRLNVYAGLAGFYFVRDGNDTGLPGNPLNLPAWPYEKAYAIQDRMFTDTGELFYPAYPGDPAYAEFIETALTPPEFPDDPRGVTGNGGGPTALAEFFGDHMVVNGVIWPYQQVEPRNYRLHLLNGTDSRFMAIQFFEVPAGATDFSTVIDGPLEFDVIGSDQGLAADISTQTTLLSEPGSRYDIIVDFSSAEGNRVIMKNIGGDEPFGGEIPGPTVFGETDRIMAFDVELPFGDLSDVDDVSPTNDQIAFGPNVPTTSTRTRKVALFEGLDEFGRLQPLLGTAEPATDFKGMPINWPDEPVYSTVGLTGQMEGSIAWHSPTTENPALNTTEEWEVWNVTGDAHPIHLHLVHFEVLGREEIVWDSNTVEAGDELLDMSIATEDDETRVIPNAKALAPAGDGTYLVTQPTVQHNSVAGDPATYGSGFIIQGHTTGPDDPDLTLPEIVENTPKDMVTALPDQVTRIKAKFDKPGRYVWHCHILSHEDHEMMRVLHVGGGHKDPSQ